MTRITGTVHEDLRTVMIISRWILLRMRNISDKIVDKFKKNQRSFFWKSWLFLDNVEKYCTAEQGRDENIIRRIRFACWTNEATNTHSEYVILIDFPWQQWLREGSSMLLRKYIARLNIYPIRKMCVLNRTKGILLNFYIAAFDSQFFSSTVKILNAKQQMSDLPAGCNGNTRVPQQLIINAFLTDTIFFFLFLMYPWSNFYKARRFGNTVLYKKSENVQIKKIMSLSHTIVRTLQRWTNSFWIFFQYLYLKTSKIKFSTFPLNCANFLVSVIRHRDQLLFKRFMMTAKDTCKKCSYTKISQGFPDNEYFCT